MTTVEIMITAGSALFGVGASIHALMATYGDPNQPNDKHWALAANLCAGWGIIIFITGWIL